MLITREIYVYAFGKIFTDMKKIITAIRAVWLASDSQLFLTYNTSRKTRIEFSSERVEYRQLDT